MLAAARADAPGKAAGVLAVSGDQRLTGELAYLRAERVPAHPRQTHGVVREKGIAFVDRADDRPQLAEEQHAQAEHSPNQHEDGEDGPVCNVRSPGRREVGDYLAVRESEYGD